MHIKTKKAISKLLISAMFFTTAFGNIDSIKAFASDTNNSRKIDVWDFGGVQASGDLYNNIISTSNLDSLTTVTAGLFAGGKTDFGDLSIAKPDAKDRLYYYKEDGTAGANSAGTWASSINKYSDGYTSGGTYYCNGTAGNTKRYLTLNNVVAGDKITVYGGTSNGDESIHFVHVAISGTTVTPDASTPQDTALDFTTKAQKVDFTAQYSGVYQIYVTATHSGKPYFHRVVRTPGVNVIGKVNLNGNVISSGYSLAVSNQTTGDVTNVTVNADNTFDTVLPAGYSYTAVLKGTTGYKISDETKVLTTSINDIAGGISNINLDVMVNSLATISGSIKGFDSSYDVSKLQIKLAPMTGSLASEVGVTVNKATMTYTADVEASQQYTAVISGVNDYELISGSSVKIDINATQDITVAKKPVYLARGKFLNLSTTAQIQNITFTNVEDGYTYNGTVANGGYSVSLRNGAYTVTPVCNEQYGTSTHIVINGENTTKDIKFNAIGVTLQPINRVPNLYVGDSSKAPYNYATVKEALDVAARMNPTNEAERITINIAPGVYRAQLKIATPYITFVNSDPSKEVKITWYYGIGYKYYSIGADGFYSEDAAFDKYTKNIANKWGGTVYLTSTATDFKAENIVFENSFNKYITDEEIADGVSLGNVAGSTITVERKSYTDATSRPATERAAAMLIEADNIEFNKCSFISSQDTLFTGNSGTNNQYYKNCFIEGNTDYIFGDGNAVFDNCTLNFCGYSDQAMGGYITAAKDTATNGYLFRNSTVTANSKNMQTAGYFGRPWGAGAKVKFLDTNLENSTIISPQGWTDMSGAKPETANFAEFNTTYNGVKVDTVSRRATVLSDITSIASTNSYFGDWTPQYYAADSDTAPTFKTVPFFTTDDDINTPYPGHTISLGYEFTNANDNLNDSSLIQWYRVGQDGKEELLKTTTAYISKTYKITTADSGDYIKAVVTPEIVNGKIGTPMSIKLDNLVRTGSGTGGATDIPDGQRVNIYIAGDSTVKTYTTARQEAGWGEYLQKFFNSDKINVVNNANGGRSTRNFINEGSLDKIASTIKQGDYLLIQFGHNDSANSSSYLLDRFVSVGVPDANGVYPSTPAVKEATPASLASYGAQYYPYTSGTFKWYLQQYIDVAKKAGATPILVTPVSRQYFNPDGTIKPHHDATDTTTGTVTSTNNAYVTAVKQLGEEQGVKVVDMFTLTKDSFEQAYKNDPTASNGVSNLAKAVMNTGDSTHNNKIGGLYDGALMAKEIQKLGYNISNNVILPTRIGGLDSYSNLLFEVDLNSKVSVYTANSSGAYTNQLDTYWTSKAQELINSLSSGSTQASVNYNLTNVTTNGSTSAAIGQGFSFNVTAQAGYNLPDTIVITAAGKELVKDVDYTYDKSKGVVTIKSVTGNIVVTITGSQVILKDFTINSTFNMSSLEAGSLLDVQTVVTNNKSSVDSVLVIVALYDGKNKMVNLSYISKNIAIGQTDKLNAGFMLPIDITNHKVKVFVWDGSSLTGTSMKSLSDVVVLQ
jgi:pectin methylesterase-like acyl-CoA thioesterase/lysophospholipase L1-like esterase